jgi:hypothetical protein
LKFEVLSAYSNFLMWRQRLQALGWKIRVCPPSFIVLLSEKLD